jgi:putative spermidine/putrescine transport system permease protein
MTGAASEHTCARGRLVVAVATIVYIYLVVPTILIVPISFGNRTELLFPPATYTLDLYRDFFESSSWLEATWRSARNAIAVAFLSLLLGVPGAYALARIDFPGKRLLVSLLLSPILVPVVVIALGLYFYYAALGLVGTLTGLILAHTMYVMPFVVISISAGLAQLDEQLETAAVIMGATRLRIFLQVVLPNLVPSLLSAGLFAFLMSFDEVVIAWFITGPSTSTLPVKMYSSIRWENTPVLAAVASLLTLLSVVICLAAALVIRRRPGPRPMVPHS